jgi:mitochondrial fission protein ELM1
LKVHASKVFPGLIGINHSSARAEITGSDKTIWVLLTAKKGDNVQSLTLAGALGLPFVVRNLHFKTKFQQSKPKVRASLHHLDAEKSDPLGPPWPDLIIVTGRRPSMAALWVKEQSAGRTKIALLGKPKGCFDRFDLVFAAAHYRLAEERTNVCPIGLPLVSIAPERLETARLAWGPKLANLQSPVTVLCFGGSTGARPLDLAAVRNIMIASVKAASPGTLYVLTSRRTPSSVYAEIAAQLPGNGMFYRWHEEDPDNPYLGLLALANRFIVTGDSISMLVEIARLGKPLAIAVLPPQQTWAGTAKRLVSSITHRQSRDFDLLHRYLYEHGWAVPLGCEFIKPVSLPPDDTMLASERLKSLLSCG